MQEYIQDLSSTIGNLENCKFSSVMLLNLINDMMDLAKSEKMKFELNSEFKFSSQNGSITLELCQADDQIFCQKKYNNI